jgi:TatD DNase family protein
MKLIDSHTHVQLKQFNPDRDEVINRALEQEIWMVTVGTTRKDSQAAVDLCDAHPEGVFATIGQHPEEREIFDYQWYVKTAQHEKVVAIGECGLDYHRIEPHLFNEERERQTELFQQHIELAKELEKPLMIHCREAFSDMKSILRREIADMPMEVPGILHFFTGTKDDAKALLDMGFMFTFGGLITFNREFDDIIRYIPKERILIETDAPFVAPDPYKGKRNEPSYVVEVARMLAEIRKAPFEDVCKRTMQNAKSAFGI